MLSSLNAVISTNERNWILTGYVIFKLRYNQIYQLETTIQIDEFEFENALILSFIFKIEQCVNTTTQYAPELKLGR